MEALTDGHLGPTFSVLIFAKTLVIKDTIIDLTNTIIEPMAVIIGSIMVIIDLIMVVIIGLITVVIIGSIIEISTEPATIGEISETTFHPEINKNLAEIIEVINLVQFNCKNTHFCFNIIYFVKSGNCQNKTEILTYLSYFCVIY